MALVSEEAKRTISSIEPCRERALWERVDTWPFIPVHVAVFYFWWTNEGFTAALWAMGVIASICGHVLLLLCERWFIDVRRFVVFAPVCARVWGILCGFDVLLGYLLLQASLESASHVAVSPQLHCGEPDIVELLSGFENGLEASDLALKEAGDPLLLATPLRWFEFQHTRFVLEEVDDAGKPSSVGVFRPLGFPLERSPAWYAERSGWTGSGLGVARARFGPNAMDLPSPTFAELLGRQMLSPFFVFQVFCMSLWFLDDYWQMSLTTLGMLGLMEVMNAFQRQAQLRSFRAMRPKSPDVWVFRASRWMRVPAEDLVPGDVLALTEKKETELGKEEETGKGKESGATVPADVMLIRGGLVVNEAMLTGESVPHRKEGVCEAGGEDEDEDAVRESDAAAILSDRPVAAHAPSVEKWLSRVSRHVAYGGTVLLSHDDGEETAGLPNPPQGGAIGYVLRTGYSTAQGDLMRKILFASERTSVDSNEAWGFIAVLLAFGLAAGGYVLYDGWDNPDRSRTKLLIDAALIVVSVVPPELPVQLSLAVTNAVNALTRKSVFCTEPFRLPLAGTLDTCCFDKTGTLTSDRLLVDGVLPASDGGRGGGGRVVAGKKREEVGGFALTATSSLPSDDAALLVLAGCHAVAAGEKEGLMGDPLEVTTLESMGWTVQLRGAARGETLVGPMSDAELKAAREKEEQEETERRANAAKRVRRKPQAGGILGSIQKAAESALRQKYEMDCQEAAKAGRPPPPKPAALVQIEAQEAAQNAPASSVLSGAAPRRSHRPSSAAGAKSWGSGLRVLRRWPFSSRLRRMSALVTPKDGRSAAASALGGSRFIVVKGAPETIETLLETVPADYTAQHTALALAGRRVIALAYKPVPPSTGPRDLTRDDAERGLRSAGFLVLDTPVKPDSRAVVRALRRTEHRVVMITGDSALTAASVAGRIGMLDPKSALRVLESNPDPASESWIDQIRWRRIPQGGGAQDMTFEAVSPIHVSAGSSPNNSKFELSENPFGDDEVCVTGAGLSPLLHAITAEHRDAEAAKAMLHALCEHAVVFARVSPEHKERVLATMNEAGRATLMCGDGTNDVGALKQAAVGVSIISDPDLEDDFADAEAARKNLFSAVGQQDSEDLTIDGDDQDENDPSITDSSTSAPTDIRGQMQRMQEDMKLIAAQHKLDLSTPSGNARAQQLAMQKQMSDMQSELGGAMTVVKFGDASIAAPFTSKKPTIKVATEIMLQGRCTLVTTQQMFRVTAVNCLTLSVMLSVLFNLGVRTGDWQGMLSMIANSAITLSLSFIPPVATLSKERPSRSVFSPPLLISVFGQFLIHLVALFCVVQLTLPFVDLVGKGSRNGALNTTTTPSTSSLPQAAFEAAPLDAPLDIDSSFSEGFDDDAFEQVAVEAVPTSIPVPTTTPTPTPDPSVEFEWDSAAADEILQGDASTTINPDITVVEMDSEFQPNPLNTGVFLVSTLQQMCTIVVNYQGEPFAQPLYKQTTVIRTLLISYAVALVVALNAFPDLTESLQFVAMPTEAARWGLVAILVLDTGLCVTLEMTVRALFGIPGAVLPTPPRRK